MSPGYFGVMDIPIVRGRAFTNRDSEHAQGVTIVTERLARRLWRGEDPIGKRIRLGFGPEEDEPWLAVVGIAGEVKQQSLAEEASPAVYVPLRQAPTPYLLNQMTFVVRGAFDPSSLAPTLRGEIQGIDSTLPVHRVMLLQGLISATVSEERFRTILLAGFAGLALALVATGIIGVLAYSVTERAREIGLRMALGARGTDIVQLVLRQAVLTTLAGVAIGLPAAAVLTRLLGSYLFGVQPHDAVTFLIASALLVAVALLAACVPARRATGVDPLVVLRSE